MNNTTQEANEKANKLSTSTSRQWGGFKNPRIVTVSRAFGGKDRHSKVCTIKGLRDRRIRLSVPTAIQLYHLQDRLGLSQPSKVIDWLIDVAKDDIDKLPPLQFPPNDFTKFQFPHSLFHDHDKKDTNSPFFSTQNANFMAQDHENINGDRERTKGKEAIEEHDNKGLNFFPMPQSCYNQGLIPYNSYYNWEYPSSNLSLSQFGSSQMDPSSLPQSSSQFFLCPSVTTTPYFAPYVMPTFVEHNDAIKQAKFVDSQDKLLFGLNIDSKVHNSQRNDNH